MNHNEDNYAVFELNKDSGMVEVSVFENGERCVKQLSLSDVENALKRLEEI